MEQIGAFIVDNWKIILEVVLLIASTIFFIVKKKPTKVVDTVQEHILRSLIYLITKAEIEFGAGHGEKKKEFVVSTLLDTLHQIYPDIDVRKYISFIEQHLEWILATPQKKGDE